MRDTLPVQNILQRRPNETQSFELFVSSWNVGGIEPPDDFDMGDLLDIHNTPADIYVLGFQEIVPLNARSIIVSENSRVSYKWNSLIRSALNKRANSTITIQKAEAGEIQKVCPLQRDGYFNSAAAFECIASKQMVGVFVTIWARTQIHHYINHIGVSCVGCGIFGRIGNKGSVSVRFRLHETTFCFVCSHLASGGNKGDEKHRNTDATQILSRTQFPSEPSQALPRKILDHDRVIWLGDLNYRIYLPEATTRSLVNDEQWSILLQNDQLRSELTEGHVFEGWHEEEIKFAPTYKYNPNSEDYYDCDQKRNSRKCRTPAWCDRIIWFCNGLKQRRYESMIDVNLDCLTTDLFEGFSLLKSSLQDPLKWRSQEVIITSNENNLPQQDTPTQEKENCKSLFLSVLNGGIYIYGKDPYLHHLVSWFSCQARFKQEYYLASIWKTCNRL